MKKIDLVTFLNNYYGIYHAKLNKKVLTHSDIKILFPNIKTCEYYSVDDLVKGNVIMVYDRNNNIRYYYNPHLNINNYVEVKEKVDDNKIALDNINQLSKEELLKLRRKLRLNNQRKESYLINKLIRLLKRKEPRIYREKKKKLMLKESIYD